MKMPDWVQLEHQAALILTEQELHGWHFASAAARELESSLREELRDIEEDLRRRHGFVAGT